MSPTARTRTGASTTTAGGQLEDREVIDAPDTQDPVPSPQTPETRVGPVECAVVGPGDPVVVHGNPDAIETAELVRVTCRGSDPR